MAGTPKTISDEKIKYASNLVTKAIEPKIEVMVEELNKMLALKGIRAGCQIEWLFDEVEPEQKDPSDA